MLDAIKKLFQKQPEPIPESKPEPKKERKPKVEPTLSPKELATKNNEPYIAILKVELDPNNINNGSFELDWNDKFLLNLIKAGFKMKETDTDSIIIDRWFQTVCRNIALELYEQQQADPDMRGMNELRNIQSRDLGNGRSEVQ
jgi:hypothetical protein